jgi:large repetitive protein
VHVGLGFNGPVQVSGAPTLTLNDGGIAKYVSGSGTNNLVFDYAIAPGQNTSDLAVKTLNLSGVRDQAGNAVHLTGAPTNPAGTLKIDTTAPALTSIGASGQGVTGGAGHLNSGTVHLTVGTSEAVTVAGTPTLSLNDGGTAKYASGSGTNKLVFDYTIGAGQRTSDLAISSFNLSGVNDLAGNHVSLTGAPTNPAGTLAIGSQSSWHHHHHEPAAVNTSTSVSPAAALPTSSIADAAGNHATVPEAATSSTSRGDAAIAGSTSTAPAPARPWFTPAAGGSLTSDAVSKLGLADATALGQARDSGSMGGASTASDGAMAARLALLGQYTASSFATSADLSGGSLMHGGALSSMQTPTLTRPQSA